MTIFEEELNTLLKHYNHLVDLYSKVIQNSPDGRLIHQMNHNQDQFLLLSSKNGVRTRTSITNDEEKKRLLAQKEFASKALAVVKSNANALKELEEKYVRFDPEKILQSMNKAYSMLPEDYFFDQDKWKVTAGLDDDLLTKIRKHEEWGKKSYKEYWGYPKNKTKTTSRGKKVRSISELLIAEKLYEYSIPFHYEELLEIDGRLFAPDFTFEGADYECFYLDYFGMMENERYARRNIQKLSAYYDAGIIPGENLLVVFDCNGVMNAGTVKGIIENEIIPRL